VSARTLLILGGVRAGKSAFAVSRARELGGRVVFVATAEPGDAEMAAILGVLRGDEADEDEAAGAVPALHERSRQAPRHRVVDGRRQRGHPSVALAGRETLAGQVLGVRGQGALPLRGEQRLRPAVAERRPRVVRHRILTPERQALDAALCR